MPTTIKLRNSVTTTSAPSSLVQGEVAINITDKKVWVGNAATTPIQLLGDGGSGSFTSIAFGAGTVSSPSITFTGDTNTGIYSPAADTIAFTEGGVESMRIDSSGNVGIGTSSPSSFGANFRILELQAGSSSAGGGYYLTGNGTAQAQMGVDTLTGYIGMRSNHPIAFTTNNAERMRIDSSGNVGIGMTPSGDSRLEVYSADSATIYKNVNTGTGTSDGFYVGMGKGSATEAYVYNRENNNLIFGTNNTERMRITSGGNVGIGLSSPTYRLQVAPGTYSDQLAVFNEAGTWTSNGGVVIADYYDNTTLIGGIKISASTATSGFLSFHTGGTTERMRITSGGNVLMGLTSAGSVVTTLFTYRDGGSSIVAQQANTTSDTISVWSSATSGDNLFQKFYTETAATSRGSIDYNRGAGLVRYNTTSDATLKNIIGDSDGQKSVGILKSTRIREYAWKDDESQKPQIGVIAQELYETYKGAVTVGGNFEKTDEEGNVTTQYRPWGVDKTAFTFHLIAGWQAHEKLIQEQQAMIEELKQEVALLKSK